MKIQPIFETTLAKDFHSAWGTFHPAGAKVTISTELNSKRFGDFLMTIPDPVSLNLDLAERVMDEAILVQSELLPKQSSTIFSTLNNFPDATAENSLKKDPKAKIFKKYEDTKLYDYLELTMSFVIHLVTAVETFVNMLIPHDYVYKEVRLFFWTKSYKKPEIERYFTLIEKLELLAKAKNKAEIKQQKFWQKFKEIKSLRDDIIHLKSSKHNANLVKVYNPIFIALFDLNHKNNFDSIIDLIKFIEPAFFRS